MFISFLLFIVIKIILINKKNLKVKKIICNIILLYNNILNIFYN